MSSGVWQAWQRLRRSIAQRGVRVAVTTALRRVLHGELASAIARPDSTTGSHAFDRETGLDTAGVVHGSALRSGHPNDLYSVAYYGSEPALFAGVLEQWLGTPGRRTLEDYSFIDFGSGKGRVVMLASEHPFRECIGVELSPELHAVAMDNLARWRTIGRALSPVSAVRGDATEFMPPETPCLVYLFNPFAGKVLGRLLDQLAERFRERPGELDLLYLHHEFRHEFERRPGFQRMWEKSIPLQVSDLADVPASISSEEEPCSGWRWVGTETKV